MNELTEDGAAMCRTLRAHLTLAAGLLLACPVVFAVNKCVDPATGAVSYSEKACQGTQGASKVEHLPVQRSSSYVAPSSRMSGRGRDRQPNANLSAPVEARQLLDLYRRWIDAERLASSTARIALAGPVAALQDLKRQASAMSTPECLVAARQALVDLTERSANGFLAFMGRETLADFVYVLVERGPAIESFELEMTGARC